MVEDARQILPYYMDFPSAVTEYLCNGIPEPGFKAPEALQREILGIVMASSESAHAYDVAVKLAATFLRYNAELPGPLSGFAADVLEGNRQRPPRSSGRPRKDRWRDYALCQTVMEIARKHDLFAYTHNKESVGVTAADIVAEAAGESLDVVIKAYQRFKEK